ncbi:hypothetical protein D5086_022359 [Populus alba]|uniref:Uncharacterized protein n=1 Tax=Populus alba TaxID=43335 RepID=A0ACC4BFB7_POPAL
MEEEEATGVVVADVGSVRGCAVAGNGIWCSGYWRRKEDQTTGVDSNDGGHCGADLSPDGGDRFAASVKAGWLLEGDG